MLSWIWNGCLPNFPWWCDGFVWTPVPLFLGLAALLVVAYKGLLR